MIYSISCLVVFIAVVIALKRVGVLPLWDRYGSNKGINHEGTFGAVMALLAGSCLWPIALPLGIVYYYVVTPKKEK